VKNIRHSAIATVKCGYCALEKDVLVNSISEPVDAFGDFIDIHYADQELQRLEKRIKKLKIDNELGELGELALCYSILSDLCKLKAAILMEDEDDVNLDDVNDWNMKSSQYKNLEKETISRLDSEELERGIKTDDETLFAEHEETGGIKKEKKIEDVFSDPGFLEF